MKITSPAFHPGDEMPLPYTCLGPNINPPLNFEDVPQDAQSLVLIFEDVDATPKPWTHWLLFNLPPDAAVAEDAVPAGATEGLANNHSFGYEGPCPKYFNGTHRYWFRLYALSKKLDLPPATGREEVELEMKNCILAQAELQVLCTAKA